MNALALYVFWAAAAGVALLFIGYPLLLKLRKKISARRDSPPKSAPSPLPRVSVIVAARNAGPMVEAKLRNCFELLHPPELLEVVFVSDGSDDDSLQRALDFADQRVRAAELPQHIGKFAALNKGVELASGEVLLFSDVDARLQPQALQRLLQHFTSEKLGGVCGRRSVTRDGAHAAEGQKRYAALDSAVKGLESDFGALTSNDGKIFAIRRECFTPVPDAVTDDLFQSLNVIAQKRAFRYEPAAVAHIPTPSRSPEHEILRRRRIVTGSLRCLFLMRRLFNPLQHGFFSLGLLINKVLRRLLPFLLLAMLGSSLALWNTSWPYRLFLVLALGGTGFALLHPLLARSPLRGALPDKLASLGFYFLVGNLGTLLGVLDFCMGRRIGKWTPRKEDATTPERQQEAPPVAYLVTRFPRLTETFVLYEMLEVQKLGLRTELHPLILEKQAVMHPEAREMLAFLHYTPMATPRTLLDVLLCFLLQPAASFGVLAAIVADMRHSPRLLLKTLAILPKSYSMARTMRRRGIAHLHAHFATHPTTCAYVIHRLTGIPYSFTAHAHDIFLDTAMLDRKLRHAAFSVTISRFNMNYLAQRLGPQVLQNMELVRCGADSGFFTPPEGKRPTQDICRITCVASFKDMKGHSDLMEACALLQQRGVAFRCQLVGSGPLREQVLQQVQRLSLQEEVLFLGDLSRESVRDLWQESDVATLPSVKGARGDMDGVPVALMEAMACGLPVACTSTSGLPELVADGVSGFVVPPHDPAALADALEKLCRSPELRLSMGRKGRATVVENFDLHKNAARLARLLRQAALEAAGPQGAP